MCHHAVGDASLGINRRGKVIKKMKKALFAIVAASLMVLIVFSSVPAPAAVPDDDDPDQDGLIWESVALVKCRGLIEYPDGRTKSLRGTVSGGDASVGSWVVVLIPKGSIFGSVQVTFTPSGLRGMIYSAKTETINVFGGIIFPSVQSYTFTYAHLSG